MKSYKKYNNNFAVISKTFLQKKQNKTKKENGKKIKTSSTHKLICKCVCVYVYKYVYEYYQLVIKIFMLAREIHMYVCLNIFLLKRKKICKKKKCCEKLLPHY